MLIQSDYKPKMRRTQTRRHKPVSTNGRIGTMLALFAFAFGLVVLRGVYLQLVEQEKLIEEGNKRYVRTLTQAANRGMITDRNGAVLALSAPSESLYAMPSEMETMPTQEQLDTLAALTGVSIETIADRLARSNSDFVYIKRQMSRETADKIRALNIQGLAFQSEPKRQYAMDRLFSHVIGFTDIDGKGQEGLELAREDDLRGRDGARVVLRDNRNNYVEGLESPRNRDAEHGKDMVLSLDQRIQSLAHNELSAAMAHHQAKTGSVVVLDAKTGEILALVNLPDYDPNHPAQADAAARRNRAVTDIMEPGSSMKPFAVAKALDAGKVNTNTWINTNPYHVSGRRISDARNYGSLDLRGVLQKSSNVGTSKLSAMFSPQEMHDYYSQLGFGRSMYSGFPGESAGRLRDWKTWQPIEQATMSFGYGLQVSLLQLARGYTIFTNDGKLLPVSFLKQSIAPQGEAVISPETARTVRRLMVSVTEPGGTGTSGAVPGYTVGGKTGTARKLVDGRYADNKHLATFVGFAPADNPRVIVAVNIDEPTQNGYYGGVVAGPVFREVMSGSLNILGVPPTRTAQASGQ